MAAVNAPATGSEEEADAVEGLGGAGAPLGAAGRNGAKLMDPIPCGLLNRCHDATNLRNGCLCWDVDSNQISSFEWY